MHNYHAQPYNLTATGFYFDTLDEFNSRMATLKDSYGDPVEEVELQFISGDDTDAALFTALGIHQANVDAWFETIEELSREQKAALFFLVKQAGESLEDALDQLDDVMLFEGSLLDAATEQFDEIHLSSIPEPLRLYIDYTAYARDKELNGDFCEFSVGETVFTALNSKSF